MTALRGGVRRLLANPGLWAASWIGLAIVAALVGTWVRAIVTSTMRPFGALEPGHVLFGLVEVLTESRAVVTTLALGILASGLLMAVAWAVLSPLCITRLAGRPWPEAAARAFAMLPAVLVQSLWHLLLRAAFMLALVLTVQSLPPVMGWSVLLLGWLLVGVALDVTRVDVCEHEAAPFHVRTAWRGLVVAIRQPGLTLPCALLSAGQLLIAASLLWLALAGLEQGSTWLPRLLAALSVGLGLARIGTVVEHRLAAKP